MEDNKERVTPSEGSVDGKLDIQEFGAAAVNVFESIRFAVETIDAKLNKVSIGSKLVKTRQQAVDNHVCALVQYAAILAIIVGLSNATMALYLVSIDVSDALVFAFSALALGSMTVAALGFRYTCTELRSRRWTDGDES